MKTNAARAFLIRLILFVLLSLYFLTVFSQADLTSGNGVLISGTDSEAGQVYKYTCVKTGGDAKVSIATISPDITGVDMEPERRNFVIVIRSGNKTQTQKIIVQ